MRGSSPAGASRHSGRITRVTSPTQREVTKLAGSELVPHEVGAEPPTDAGSGRDASTSRHRVGIDRCTGSPGAPWQT